MQQMKGQSLVEFALAMPLLLLLVFGIIYTGMLFHDYSTLSALARSSTREAAITTESPSEGRYSELEQKYIPRARDITTSLYTLKSEDPYIIKDAEDNSVVTTIYMVLSPGSSQLMREVIPKQFVIQYYMRKDKAE